MDTQEMAVDQESCTRATSTGSAETSMLLYMVKTRSWPAEQFRALLDDVMRRTQLSQAQLAAYVPIDQSQFSRWKAGTSRPGYERLATLGRVLQREHPELGIGPEEVLAAAGYTTDTQQDLDTAETRAAAPTPHLESAAQSSKRQTVDEMRAEMDKLMAQMSPKERANLDAAIEAEEAELEILRLKRRLRWLKMMRGESIYPEEDI